MNRPFGKVVRPRPRYCFIRSDNAGVAKEFFAHVSDFVENAIPPEGAIVTFTPCMPRKQGAEFSAEFCEVVKSE